MASCLRDPIDLHPDKNKAIGHCRVSIPDDGKLCSMLAAQYYTPGEGARTLTHAVGEMERLLGEQDFADEEEVTEDTNFGSLQEFVVKKAPVVGEEWEMSVVRVRGRKVTRMKEIQTLGWSRETNQTKRVIVS